ncbi:GGDEF domain-containing protein [Scandinavium goeteborgense]|uniref:GGDEF domain-containing protein n=1 Tax=Scandinavium goeteborgense TaxID=1851514 RepID=UPI0037F72098
MKKQKKVLSSSNVLRFLWGSTSVTLALTAVLSGWLFSNSWSAWHSARNSVIQFEDFYKVLKVSNDLATERAFANELVLSQKEDKAIAWASLDKSRQITDRDLAEIPTDLLSHRLLTATMNQLKPARRNIEQFRQSTLTDPDAAQHAVDSMVAATDFYHKALFRRTSEFLRLEPSASGPIVRAQALGELRDATGRLGSKLIIPLATNEPIPMSNIDALSRGEERISVIWWLLRIQGGEAKYLPGFMQLLDNTRMQFEQQGVAMINTLVSASEKGKPYSVNAKSFAVRYHASLGSFNELLDTYIAGVKKYYVNKEQQALRHLLIVAFILIVLCLSTTGLIFYVRSRVLQPILRLNEIATGIIAGKQLSTLMDESTATEVQNLFSSLGTLGAKLREQIQLSKTLQRQSEEDPLTQVFNRRAFDILASDQLKLASPHQPAWFIMMDVDHFKSINDTWGHPTGDKVLIQLATTLKKFSRPGDVIGRLGGEEFAIVFSTPGHEDVTGYTTRIQNEIRRLRFEGPKGESFSVTASFGVASGWQRELNEVLAQADIALYEAKNSGRDRICGLPNC